MANVNKLEGTWVGGAFYAGQEHNWIAWGFFDFGDIVSVMVHPVSQSESVLEVTNVQTQHGADGSRRLFYTVRNVGYGVVHGYNIGFSIIS